ncbi:hypothetical protein BC829DRAFT_191979 [Chytridium lagenaria]|nr:hypothetical protein BC829DRAFT_191979 [Chytridium lagenaria]
MPMPMPGHFVAAAAEGFSPSSVPSSMLHSAVSPAPIHPDGMNNMNTPMPTPESDSEISGSGEDSPPSDDTHRLSKAAGKKEARPPQKPDPKKLFINTSFRLNTSTAPPASAPTALTEANSYNHFTTPHPNFSQFSTSNHLPSTGSSATTIAMVAAAAAVSTGKQPGSPASPFYSVMPLAMPSAAHLSALHSPTGRRRRGNHISGFGDVITFFGQTRPLAQVMSLDRTRYYTVSINPRLTAGFSMLTTIGRATAETTFNSHAPLPPSTNTATRLTFHAASKTKQALFTPLQGLVSALARAWRLPRNG